MNIIFLDIDGVLNCSVTKEKTEDLSGVKHTGIDDEFVQKLAEIVKASESQIVLTSPWKTLWDEPGPRDEMNPMAEYLLRKLQNQGLHITDRTLDRGKGDRGYGIKRWLKRFPEVERWIVLDDEVFPDYEIEGIIPHLIKTSFSCGLTDENVRDAIAFLTKPHKSEEGKRRGRS